VKDAPVSTADPDGPAAGHNPSLPEDVLARRAPVGIVVVDAQGVVVWANPAAARILGAVDPTGPDPASFAGRPFADVVHPDDRPTVLTALERRDETPVAVRTCAGGEGRPVSLVAVGEGASTLVYLDAPGGPFPGLDPAGGVSRYQRLVRDGDDTVVVCDAAGTVRRVFGNPDDLLGWSSGHWEGRSVFDCGHPDELEIQRQAWAQLLRMPGVPLTREVRVADSSGRWVWLQLTGTNLLEDPAIGAIVLVGRDITRTKEHQRLQRDQYEIFELIACAAPLDLVLSRLALLVEEHLHRCCAGFFLLEDGRLRAGGGSRLPPSYVSSVSGPRPRWFGALRAALLTGRTAIDADVAAFDDERRSTLGDAASVLAIPVQDELSEHEPCGALVVHLLDARTLRSDEEIVALAATRLASIALQRHRTQQQLSYLAHHDHLTGLPNRARVQSKLDDAIAYARTHNTSLAVMFLDIDNFKIVNDSLGHSAGDHVLVGFAERLSEMLRPGDTVGRFGGDEFVVLLENITSIDDAVLVADRLLEDFSHPLRIGDETVFLSLSIGIAISVGGHDSSDVLLRNADSAMYQAKSRGRARVEVFDDGHPARSARRLQLEGDLHRALDLGQFELHWQPKVALDTGRIVCAEALVRWRHPERGLIHPTEFIRVTEEIELIVRIGAWVLDEAIRQRAAWEAVHGDEAPWSIAVNVSALQLAAPRAMDSVLQVLRRWRWAPERLVLELTESVLVDDDGETSPILQDLKDLGVQLAIDDFGTGYSSLSYLHRYPVDHVKLDRSFVTPIDEHGEGSAIARAVINMAHALGISVTAEGVETEAQLRGLRVLGCDWAQGFLFSPPLPAEDFAALLTTHPRYF
jgi:diguanylate cyclase (GGDEF)-like protein/PAS domain S-box-containing protein